MEGGEEEKGNEKIKENLEGVTEKKEVNVIGIKKDISHIY